MSLSYINIVTAIIFVIVSTIFTVSLFYIDQDKKNLYNNKNSMQQDYNSTIDESNEIERDVQPKMVRIAIHKQPRIIKEDDRINFIRKCNYVDKELEGLLSKQFLLYNRDQKNILMEKRNYINQIKEIVNDLTFNNRKEFEQLYSVLKEIQKDVSNQNSRITDLEDKVSKDSETKNELTNMLIQRMIYESSKQSLQKPRLTELLKEEVNDKEDELKLLEKYIIKTIRKQVDKEKQKVSEKSQEMNPVSNIELHRKSELMDIMNEKLLSMENLYKNINSNKKKEIVSIVKEPVKTAVRSYIRVEDAKPKCNKKMMNNSNQSQKYNTSFSTSRHRQEEDSNDRDDSFDLSMINKDLKVIKKNSEANAFYVTN